MSLNQICPSCGSVGMTIFYKHKNVPVNSVLLLSTRRDALDMPKGDIALGFCESCGFISNLAYDPKLLEYSSKYESTQAFSATFNIYHRELATRLIERYDLHNKKIIEIGCGQGEFLTLLCEIGGNRGVGFDPVYSNDMRDQSKVKDGIRFIKDFYSEKYAHYRGDFVCCKMTLEHIPDPADFVTMVRHSIGESPGTIVFFQVPDVARILRELAFWDIYYEHCSYFSMGSLARLFHECGFNVIDIASNYDDQYLMITSEVNDELNAFTEKQSDVEITQNEIIYFADNYQNKLEIWRQKLQKINQSGQRTVIWGASSKGVSFLTTLNIQSEIEYAVDINPFKQGTYIAGTGQKIVAPEFLREYEPDIVLVMNPIYCNEIRQSLDRLGIAAELMQL